MLLALQTAVPTWPSPLLAWLLPLLLLLSRLLLQTPSAGLGPQAMIQAGLAQQQGPDPWQQGQEDSGLLPRQGPMLPPPQQLQQQRPRAATAAP